MEVSPFIYSFASLGSPLRPRKAKPVEAEEVAKRVPKMRTAKPAEPKPRPPLHQRSDMQKPTSEDKPPTILGPVIETAPSKPPDPKEMLRKAQNRGLKSKTALISGSSSQKDELLTDQILMNVLEND